jgi:hypothetical protein
VFKKLLFAVFVLSGFGTFAQNAPISTISVINSYSNTATVPVTAINMTNIGSYSLEIQYDQTLVLPVSITAGSLLGGSLSVNLTNPGIILVSWYTYPGITLSGSPVILNLNFSKVLNGTSVLSFLDNGYSCAWYDGNSNLLNDQPTSTYYVAGSLSFNSADAPHCIAPSFTVCQGATINIPIKVTAFNAIGSVSLKLNYDATALNYQSFTNNSGFPGLAVDGTQSGTILISGIIGSNPSGFSLVDSAILVTLNFNFSFGNSTLVWVDNGASCQYTGPPPAYFILNDSPQGTFYLNGVLTGIPLPEDAGTIVGPQGGNVCEGQSGVNFSITPIQNANTYVWALPPGATITSGEWTNSIMVTFNNTPGNGALTVYGNNTCGNGAESPDFPISVNMPPSINSQPVSPDSVDAGAGSASFTVEAAGSSLTYQWQENRSTWTNLSNGGVYSGTYSPILTITNPSAPMNGYHYRCIMSGLCPPQAITDGEAMLSLRIVTGIENKDKNESGDPKILILSVNPNPVTPVTRLNYFLPTEGHFSLEIRNIVGDKIKVLFDGNETRGWHQMNPDLDMNSGIYIVTLALHTLTELNTIAKKIIVQ